MNGEHGMSSRWPTSLRLVATLFTGLFCHPLFADYTLNMTEGITPISQHIHRLHMTILWICVAIGVLVYSLMIYAIVRHRKKDDRVPAAFHESTTVEVIWTLIPFIILIAMAVPASKTLISMHDTSKADITIKVTGYRWHWHYDYLDEDINFMSYLSTPEDQIMNRAPKGEHYLLEVDKPLVVPVGKKIRILTTSKDVIHSWWVPALGVKKDAIPGFINETWAFIDADKPGTYRGQCAELCGTKHGYMPIVVEAKSEADYLAWVEAQKADAAKAAGSAAANSNKVWTKDELMVEGEKEYERVCKMCHQQNGKGTPPTFPSLVGSLIVTKPEHKVEHIRQMIYGKNLMPALGEQLNDFQIAAIATYERNAWGNNTGDVCQPSEVKAVREQFKKN